LIVYPSAFGENIGTSNFDDFYENVFGVPKTWVKIFWRKNIFWHKKFLCRKKIFGP